jgi:hypothetical protein
MAKKTNQITTQMGRPSQYSDELADEIILRIQSGDTLFEIGMDNKMPSFRTIVRWRRTRPDFCHMLEAIEEDQNRDARRSMREVVGIVHGALTKPFTFKFETVEAEEKNKAEEMARAFVLANVGAANFVTAGFERIAKVPVMKEVEVIETRDDSNMSAQFDALHPITQDKIKQALLDDQRLRGEGEEDDD